MLLTVRLRHYTAYTGILCDNFSHFPCPISLVTDVRVVHMSNFHHNERPLRKAPNIPHAKNQPNRSTGYERYTLNVQFLKNILLVLYIGRMARGLRLRS